VLTWRGLPNLPRPHPKIHVNSMSSECNQGKGLQTGVLSQLSLTGLKELLAAQKRVLHVRKQHFQQHKFPIVVQLMGTFKC